MKTTLAALAVMTLGAGPALALDGPGRALLPSDTELQIASDAVLTGPAGDTVQRSFIPPYSGVVRVKWEVRSGDGTMVSSAADVVHLSTCVRDTSSTTFAAKVCNLRVAEGVPLTISASPSNGGNSAELRNVRIYYRVVDSKAEAIVYTGVPDI